MTSSLVLDASQFHLAASAPSPQIAVFDCDGTLWSGDAGSAFMAWSIETGLVTPDRKLWLDERYALYLRGEVSEAAICGEMVQVYAGLHEAQMREATASFVVEYVQPRVFAPMRRLVQELQASGAQVWAVSSTNNWVIEAGVEPFGISAARVLAAEVQVDEAGHVTDRLVDVPTDEGKAVALRRAGVPAPDAVFGNSIHDAAMLAMAARPFAVNPTVALEERAAESGWPVFWPQGDGSSK